MESLNRTYTQIADLFRSMTPGARITAGLLLAVVIISLLFLYRSQSVGQRDLLLGGARFRQVDIGTMTAALSKKGLGGWKIVGDQISIPRGRKAEYLAALGEENALPSDALTAFDEALKDESWTTTRALREKRLKIAKQKMLSKVIGEMKDVEWAVVHFDEEKSRGILGKVDKRAGAMVKLRGDRHLTEEQIRSIRNTVAAFVSGLDRKNVTITDSNSQLAHVGVNEDGSPTASEDPYASRKRMYEQDYRSKILRALKHIPGVWADVNVELTKKLRHRERSLMYDKDGYIYESEEETTNQQKSLRDKGGRPGAAPNGVGPNTSAQISRGISSTEKEISSTEESRSRQRGVTGNQMVMIEQMGMTPSMVSAAVSVPASYFVEMWKQRNGHPAAKPPPRDDPALQRLRTEIIQQLEKKVAALLPVKPPGEDRYQPVTVTVYEDLRQEEPPPPSLMDDLVTWLTGNWTTLGMFLLGGVSLFVLRGMVRQTNDPHTPAAPDLAVSNLGASNSAAGEQENQEEENADDNDAEPARRFGPNLSKQPVWHSGDYVQNDLSEMVRENPDAAANVLRSWMSEAA